MAYNASHDKLYQLRYKRESSFTLPSLEDHCGRFDSSTGESVKLCVVHSARLFSFLRSFLNWCKSQFAVFCRSSRTRTRTRRKLWQPLKKSRTWLQARCLNWASPVAPTAPRSRGSVRLLSSDCAGVFRITLFFHQIYLLTIFIQEVWRQGSWSILKSPAVSGWCSS